MSLVQVGGEAVGHVMDRSGGGGLQSGLQRHSSCGQEANIEGQRFTSWMWFDDQLIWDYSCTTSDIIMNSQGNVSVCHLVLDVRKHNVCTDFETK